MWNTLRLIFDYAQLIIMFLSDSIMYDYYTGYK